MTAARAASAPPSQGSGSSGSSGYEKDVAVVLFDAKHNDRRDVAFDAVDFGALAETQLLWIDCDGLAAFERVCDRLELPPVIRAAVGARREKPGLASIDSYFWICAIAIRSKDGLRFVGCPLDIVAGRNLVLTIRRDDADEWPPIDGKPEGESDLGRLDAGSFVASLLHHLLATYFDAVTRIEVAIERIDQAILDPKHVDCIKDLRNLLHATSRIRRKLAAHRRVFSGLARPDFRPSEHPVPERHFAALDDKYERAMDVAENTRDLVIACFELFSTRTALSTNETMRTLTFLTLLIGFMSVTAGILGMNFQLPMFESKSGFWITLAFMGAVVVVSVLVGKRRRWL